MILDIVQGVHEALLWLLSIYQQSPILNTVLLFICIVAGSYYAIRPRNLPPGPWGIPWIGSPFMFGDNVHQDFDRLAKTYGAIYTIMMGTRPMIIINTNRLIKEAFVKNAHLFSNRPVMFALEQNQMYDELFNKHYSEEWKGKKKTMTRIHRGAGFGSANVEPIFMASLDKLYEQLDQTEGEAFVPKNLLHNFLCMVICEVVFDGKYKFGDREIDEVRAFAVAWVDSMFRSGMSLSYFVDCVPNWITKHIFPRTLDAVEKSGILFQAFLMNKVAEHREAFDPNNIRDVIDGFLSERGNDPELTDNVLACNVFMLFPDAIDSTGNFLEFITFYLAYDQDWQRKVQDQITEVCGDRKPTLEDRSKLSRVEATMYEAGRIGNVVSLSIAHSAQQDTTFEGYNIPEDSYILANLYAAHMEPELFPQGDRFEPERLVDECGKLVKNPKIMFFGVGRRMCIGEQMAKNEAFLYISNVLQRYTLKFPDGEPLPSTDTHGGLIRAPLPFKIQAVKRVIQKE